MVPVGRSPHEPVAAPTRGGALREDLSQANANGVTDPSVNFQYPCERAGNPVAANGAALIKGS